jgi:beta-mannosidase
MAKESPFVKDKASTNALTLSRRNFIAQTGLGTAAILMNGIPCAAAYSALDKALPHGEAADEKAAWAPTHVSLDGKWKLFYFPQGKHQVSEPRQLKAAGLTAIDATVPGDAPLELSRIGELPADLIAGLNTTKMRPYELYEWWYQREFPTPAGIAGKRLELCFNGVDCLATYWLNGAKIGESDNALIAHSFDVTDKLNVTGPNTITVRLRSAELEAVGKNYDPAYTVSAGPNNQEGVWIRKPAHSWGWNIMPRAVSSGLWRSVELIVHAPQEIPELYFATLSVEPGKAELHVSYNVTTELTLLPQLQLKVKGECGDSTFSHLHHLEFSAGRFSIPVANPRLWWPRGYGEASLYKVTTQLLQGEKVLATREDTIGIRKLELIRTETTTPDKPGQFLFKVNGVPILVKGSNWVPADAFHSCDAGRYEQTLALFSDLQCNMLRSWGGGVYEDDAFFSICDRDGIMVWQDFAMACAIYPVTLDFQEQIRKEAISVVRKLRNHPSLALWSGDNEDDIIYHFAGLDPSHNVLTREVLPQVVFQCDPYRPFLPSSPYMAPETVAANNMRMMPEEHLWNTRDYFKSAYYTEHPAHFVSEIGFDGCPSLSGLKRFIDDKNLWPWQNNAVWTLHSASQVGDDYENKLLAKELKDFYGEIPDKIEDFIYASQTSQAEAYKYLIEMTRLKKWRRTGVIWWNVIDGWPLISDSVVDYYFNKKLAYHFIKRVQHPVVLMVDELEGHSGDDWSVHIVMGNDSCQDASGHFKVWDADSGETLLEEDYTSKANENVGVGKIQAFHSDKKLFLMEWTAGGKRYVNHYLLGTPAFSLAQYKAWLPKIAALQNDFDPAKVGV